jgi:flavocytochrome c
MRKRLRIFKLSSVNTTNKGFEMTKLSLLSAACLFALSATAAQAADGVYKATTMGRNGDVTVQVTIKGNKIADVKVLDWSESHPIADLPLKKIPEDIVKHQTTNLDTISGATFTSFAIKNAVNDCLKQAGLNLKDFSKKAPKPALATGTVTENTDVLVIGGGGAGMSAALAAAEAGKKVVVMEKNHYIGGNTSVCGGCYNAADAEHQKNLPMTEGQIKQLQTVLSEAPKNALHEQLLKIANKDWQEHQAKGNKFLFDTPELHALQTWKAGDYAANLALVYKLAKMVPDTQKKLESIGMVFKDRPVQYIGAIWPRSHLAKNYKSGVGYIDTYLQEIKNKNYPVQYLLSTPATDLIVKDGRVIGAVGKAANGKTYKVFAKDGVVIATGGFSANIEMRTKYDTIWGGKLGPNVKTSNVPSITGDGIRMADKIGANLVDMGYIQVLPTTDPKMGGTNHRIADSTSIFVNRDGKRFVNELERRDVLSKAALAQPGSGFFIISTEKTNLTDKDGRNSYGVKVESLIHQGKVFKGATLEELAGKIGMNAENLKKTVAKWNEFCKTQKNDEFGRQSCSPKDHMIEEGPYYAAAMVPGVHHTMGGIQIDTDTHVLNKSGKIIPGLYAAGEVTGGIHGTNRVGCNAVPDVLNFGRLAGTVAATGK